MKNLELIHRGILIWDIILIGRDFFEPTKHRDFFSANQKLSQNKPFIEIAISLTSENKCP